MNYLLNYLKRILGKDLDEKLKKFFLDGAYKSLLMQGSIALLTFLTSILIARIAGAESFGLYSVVFTWISILSVGATFGLDDLLLKEIPPMEEVKDWDGIHSILQWANVAGIVVSLSICLLFTLFIYTGLYPPLSNSTYYYLIALPVIPCFVLVHTNQSALRAIGQFARGQYAEKFIQPFAFFLLIVLVGSLFYLNDEILILLRGASFVVAALVALYLIVRTLPIFYKKVNRVYKHRLWSKRCFYFSLISMLYMLNTRLDILFLEHYQVGHAKIAYYNVAQKFADLALIPFLVICTVVTPMFARLYAKGAIRDLQLLYTKTTRIGTIVIAIILLFAISTGDFLLTWYGKNFVEGYGVLCLLCLIKFIHVFVGPLNYLLMVCDQERSTTIALLISVVFTGLLHAYLIPLYGLEGAAWGTIGGLVLFEILISYIAYRYIGIFSTGLGSFFGKK